MSTADRIAAVRARWQEARQRGEAPSPEDLCRDCPDLLDEVRRQIASWPDAPAAEAGPALLEPGPSFEPGAEPVPGYRLVRHLGRGGAGVVWKAVGPGGFPVALKFCRLRGGSAAQEARSLEWMKEVRHAHLLSFFGAWHAGDLLVVAMELADGTLGDRLGEALAAGRTGIRRSELLEYMREAAEGIDYLNGRQHTLSGRPGLGIQHRDIKPQNLLLVGRSVKVGDFGQAKLMAQSLTGHTGVLTLPYAAPEFFRDQTSTRSDQYSLAVTYCQLRGGRLPFRGLPALLVAGHLSGAPDLSMVPEGERPAVARALAKDPEQRWPSCRDFVAALAASGPAADDSGIAPAPPDLWSAPTERADVAPPGPPGRRRGRLLWLALAAAALLALGLALLHFRG